MTASPQRSLDEQLGLLSALGDATRLRLCALLADHELSVAELTAVLEVGQSKVSTHLARLKDQALVLDRKAGTSSYYRLNLQGMPAATRKVWEALRGTLDDVTLHRDRDRARSVLDAREGKSWPERMAGELERHYSPGRTWESLARGFGAMFRAGDVLDIGAGDGTVASMLSPRTRRYTCLDVSAALVSAAEQRLAREPNISVVRGDMHALPFGSESFDVVLMFNALAYADDPLQALDEAARVVRCGGELVVVTLARHDHMDVAAQYGHRQPGFDPRWLKKRLISRGMLVSACQVTSRERQRPHFEIVTCVAQKA